MTDVLLVSMPFGPLFSPSLGLSLLQPQIHARGLSCRVEYFTLAFAEQVVGQDLYGKVASESRAMSRAFAGEWIFSAALFDWSPEQVAGYLENVLLKPPSWLGRNPTRPTGPREIRALLAARESALAFIDCCADCRRLDGREEDRLHVRVGRRPRAGVRHPPARSPLNPLSTSPLIVKSGNSPQRPHSNTPWPAHWWSHHFKGRPQ